MALEGPERNRMLTTMAMFIAMAVVLHWVEGFIPRPAPFMRLGLANIFTLCAIYMFGGAWGMVVLVCRVILGSILSASIFTPAFAFSLGGGMAAACVMWGMPRNIFSPVGTSVAGSCAHMFTQVLIAAALIRHVSLINMMPLFLITSLVTGIINGLCAKLVLDAARNDASTILEINE